MKLLILGLSLFSGLAACSAKDDVVLSPKSMVSKKSSVSIMTFNVENLFDTSHDQGKSDYTFLPLHQKRTKKHIEGCNKIRRKKWRHQCLYWDWNEGALKEKLKRIAGSIKQVHQGAGPDIIVFQEIENIKILERLRTEFLAGLGYGKSILIEGTDMRGIDVAMMSKLPTHGTAKLHHVTYSNISNRRKKDTRGILEQSFLLPDGQILTGFATHFPAPFHPFSLRIDSYKFLNSLLKKLPEGRLSFAAGDFNTPFSENKQHKILERFVSGYWVVAHQVGCQSCPGTNYYFPKKSWSFLDMILLSKNLLLKKSGWKLSRVYLANEFAEQKSKKGRPNSFRVHKDKIYGVSDHWPLVTELQLLR